MNRTQTTPCGSFVGPFRMLCEIVWHVPICMVFWPKIPWSAQTNLYVIYVNYRVP